MTTSFARFGLACALALTLSAAVAKAETASAKVTSVYGSAQYSMDGQTWMNLMPGMTLQPGAIVRTAAGSHADVLLGRGGAHGTVEPVVGSLVYFPEASVEQANMVRVLGDSVLSIDTLNETMTGINPVSETQLDLRKGEIFFSVKKLAAGSSFEIKCPKGIAGIRGTMGWMNDQAVIRLALGVVVDTFYAADGVTTRTQVIHGRQMFDPATGLLQNLSQELYQQIIQIVTQLTGATPAPTTIIGDPTLRVTSGISPATAASGDQTPQPTD